MPGSLTVNLVRPQPYNVNSGPSKLATLGASPSTLVTEVASRFFRDVLNNFVGARLLNAIIAACQSWGAQQFQLIP